MLSCIPLSFIGLGTSCGCVQFIKDNAHMFHVEGSMVALAEGQASETSKHGDSESSSSAAPVSREDANDNCSVQAEDGIDSTGHMVNGAPGSVSFCSYFAQKKNTTFFFFNVLMYSREIM